MQTQFLHCIEQCRGKGGENTFVDGFRIAECIRENHGEDWESLVRIPVDYWDTGREQDFGEFYKLNAVPTFQ